MMASTSPEGKSRIIKPCTVGEELYLVHLQRQREDANNDAEQHRKRDHRTIGEELWEIHSKRSRGRQDNDRDELHVEDGHSSDNSTHEVVSAGQKCPYNLRSRDCGKMVQ
jgi:hypothetical protein